jgi:hypothetical protein
LAPFVIYLFAFLSGASTATSELDRAGGDKTEGHSMTFPRRYYFIIKKQWTCNNGHADQDQRRMIPSDAHVFFGQPDVVGAFSTKRIASKIPRAIG